MSVTTLETWSIDLTDEQRSIVNVFLQEQSTAGKLLNAGALGVFGNTTNALGNVIANVSFTWSDTDSANTYLAFISNLNPVSASIVS